MEITRVGIMGLLYQMQRSTLGALVPNKTCKSFSNGVKFKSKHTTLRQLFNLFNTCTVETTGNGEKLSFMESLCLLICPPKAWPVENSWPQMEHSWVLGLVDKLRNCACSFAFSPINLGFLWLVRWPPNAWNDEKQRWQVLHLKTSLTEWSFGLVSRPWDSNIRHLAMSKPWISPFSLSLFIMTS